MEKGNVLQFQPWRFVVIEDQMFRQKLLETVLPIWRSFMVNMKEMDPELYKNVIMLYEKMDEPKDLVYYSAPVIVFVIGPIANSVSCALCCENIMLAATSLGIGSCYVGFGAMVKGNAEIVKALELSEGERIYGPILIGYPRDAPEKRFMDQHDRLYVGPKIKWI
jgi:nitroreductase